MSIVCKVNNLNEKLRHLILKELQIEKTCPKSKNPLQPMMYQKENPVVITYRIMGTTEEEMMIYIPFHFGLNVLELSRPLREIFPSHSMKFKGTLRETQLEVRKQAIEQLNQCGTTLLALHVGFGKSVLAIELACKIKLRTLIIVHRVVLLNQWKSYLEKYCDSPKICLFESYEEGDVCDVFLINVLNVSKLPQHIRSTFGFVIVDECHLISTQYFSQSLQYITPRYLVGLSATPYRNDGMDKIMDLYFGKERLVRKLRIEHTVYKIQTSFEPPIVQMRNGQLDWNAIINAQSTNPIRNEMIVGLTTLYPDRRILILCKRKEQGMTLHNLLKTRGEQVTRLMGNDRKFDENARILIATINKAGVGFSHDVLDTLILAADVEEYYIQYLGRITRRPDVKPLIFDIVDKNSTLQRHFTTRKKVYKEIGGTILDFHKSFPSFPIL